MKQWIILSLAATCCWGFWSLFGKLASRSLSSHNLMLHSSFGTIFILFVSLLFFHKHIELQFNSVNHCFAIIAGTIGGIGGLFFFLALSKGNASQVVAITALYPVLTVVLSVLFLKEDFNTSRVTGVLLATGGIYLLSK